MENGGIKWEAAESIEKREMTYLYISTMSFLFIKYAEMSEKPSMKMAGAYLQLFKTGISSH